MALTIPSLGKALEDVTQALHQNNNELKKVKDVQTYAGTLINRLHAKLPAIGTEDFAEEAAAPVFRNITPETIKSAVYTIEAKTDNNNACEIVVSSLGIFENGKTYIISADFKTDMQPPPKAATIECVNATSVAVIASSDIPVVNGKCSIKLTISYKLQQSTDEVKLLLYAGKKGSTAGIAGTYTHLKIEAVEILSQEKQQEKVKTLLDSCTTDTKPYYNVLRNKNGSITIPEPHHDTEAVNKGYVDTQLAAHGIGSESKMPLNPVCAYDMADLHYRGKTLYRLSEPIIGKRDAFVINGGRVYEANKAGAYYHVYIETTFTGGAHPALILYREDWKGSIINEYCRGARDYVVFIPQQNKDFNIGVWMRGDSSYQVQPDDSVNVYSFVVTEITERMIIDNSGRNNHAILMGDVEKESNNMTGSALGFTRGSLSTRYLSSYIGVGKRWSHSRFIKIATEQDKTTNPRLWDYGSFDYCFFNVQANGGNATAVYINTYKDEANSITVRIPPEKILTNKWAHLVVMTDLQDAYCRKIVYLNQEKIADVTVEGDFRAITSSYPGYCDMAITPDRDYTRGALASLLFFDRLLTEPEIQWLGRNPYYPAKRYSLAEYKADENRALLETLQKELKTLVPKSAFSLTGSTLSMKM